MKIQAVAGDACRLVLLPPSGSGTSSAGRIARLQAQVSQAKNPAPYLERLGWAFIAEARRRHDPGLYALAEKCADCIETHEPRSAMALLLRGRVLHVYHRFREAEAVGRALVARRGHHTDYALLGDALLDQGRTGEAAAAYQEMIDQRPGPQSYARAAEVRWARGDVDGAIELMRIAVRGLAGSRSEHEVWMLCRLAQFRLRTGEVDNAAVILRLALRIDPEYPTALNEAALIEMSRGRYGSAVRLLQRASEREPLPVYLWALFEAAERNGDTKLARKTQRRLESQGATEDPRSYALYLASRGQKIEVASRLVKEELRRRRDASTWGTAAWVARAAGRTRRAYELSQRALAAGSQTPRLLFQAGVVAHADAHPDVASALLTQAEAVDAALLPSERELLQKTLKELSPRRHPPP